MHLLLASSEENTSLYTCNSVRHRTQRLAARRRLNHLTVWLELTSVSRTRSHKLDFRQKENVSAAHKGLKNKLLIQNRLWSRRPALNHNSPVSTSSSTSGWVLQHFPTILAPNRPKKKSIHTQSYIFFPPLNSSRKRTQENTPPLAGNIGKASDDWLISSSSWWFAELIGTVPLLAPAESRSCSWLADCVTVRSPGFISSLTFWWCHGVTFCGIHGDRNQSLMSFLANHFN